MDRAKIGVLLAILAVAGYMAYDWYSTPEEPVVKETKDTIYKYTDKNGVVHYTNDKADIPAEYRDNLSNPELPDLNVLDEEAAKNMMLLGKENLKLGSGDITRAKRINLYQTSWCPNCAKVRKLLEDLKVGYAVFDVEKDSRAMQVLQDLSKGSNSVPLLEVDGRLILGYRPTEIREAVLAEK